MTNPLILASGSAIRAQLLTQAGLSFAVQPSKVDEDAIKDQCLLKGVSPKAIALRLAEEKALDVSRHRTGWVIGADSVVQLDKELISKSPDMKSLRAQLQSFSGRDHYLHSAAAISSGAEIIWSTVQTARLSVRRLSPDFIDDYLARAGEGVLASVGGYQLEGLGIHLFDAIEGDYFTILGLPLLPLLQQLRHLEVLKS